jgi:hypothetical protein
MYGFESLRYEHMVALNLSATDFIEKFSANDVANQLKFAMEYLSGDANLPNWVLNLWPPGMPIIDGAVLFFSGAQAIPLKFYIIAIFIYALTFFLVYRKLSVGKFSPSLLILCSLAPFFIYTFRISLFSGFAFMSSDYFCFILLALVWVILAKTQCKNYNNLYFAMAILILMAYLRTFYFSFFYFLILVVFLIASIKILVQREYKKIYPIRFNKVIKKPITKIFLVFCFGWVLFLPWKLIYLQKYVQPFEWTMKDQVWAAQWRNDYPDNTFLVGINIPCQVEPDICAKLFPFQLKDTWATPILGADFYKRLTLSTFIAHPFSWLSKKLELFPVFWFNSGFKGDWWRGGYAQGLVESSVLLIGCLILGIVAIYRTLKNIISSDKSLLDESLYIFSLAFILYNIIVFNFAHFEARYSMPLKLLAYLFILTQLSGLLLKLENFLSFNKFKVEQK